MGWRGTFRAMEAASRAAARDSDRLAKQRAKAEMISDVSDAVEEWEALIEKLTTVASIVDTPLDWQKAAIQPKPAPPQKRRNREDLAQRALNAFTPSFWDFLQGGSKQVEARLNENLSSAIQFDQEEFVKASQDYEQACSDREAEISLARRALARDPAAFKEIVSEAIGSFKNNFAGEKIEFQFGSDFVSVVATIFPVTIIPKYRRKQLASGRLSETEMPALQRYQLYQDYVASVAFSAATSTLHILPIEEVYVTCKTEMLNTATGHMEVVPILSGLFVRETLERMNLSNIDPSDALANFKHVMIFKRASGFSAVKPLIEPEILPLSGPA